MEPVGDPPFHGGVFSGGLGIILGKGGGRAGYREAPRGGQGRRNGSGMNSEQLRLKRAFMVHAAAAAFAALAFAALAFAFASAAAAQPMTLDSRQRCGEPVTLEVRERTRLRYAFFPAAAGSAAAASAPVALVLLPGGSGHVDLDERGCVRQLIGNSLVRSVPLFVAAGFAIAVVDAPSDHHGEDGLAGFRTAIAHAQELGKVIASLRARTGGTVWVVGTSRGSISAVNAGTRLAGPEAPDGLVLTSVLTVGTPGARRAYVAQTVFDLPLAAIKVPLLLVGHAADACLRSPASSMDAVLQRATAASRRQAVLVTGGPGRASGGSSLADCEGRSPHGFIEQEQEVADGIARFIRGGAY
jgi:hypothetical protein